MYMWQILLIHMIFLILSFLLNLFVIMRRIGLLWMFLILCIILVSMVLSFVIVIFLILLSILMMCMCRCVSCRSLFYVVVRLMSEFWLFRFEWTIILEFLNFLILSVVFWIAPARFGLCGVCFLFGVFCVLFWVFWGFWWLFGFFV